MAKPKPEIDSETRRQILSAALKRFAHAGYAATSVQQIVDDAGVSKPALYYYFKGKAGLFQALVSEAHEERYHVTREAAARERGLRAQLVEVLAALFNYFGKNRELTRLAFATAFAAPGEVPRGLRCFDKIERNFEFMHSLIKRALADGELDGRFDSQELALGFYGQTNLYLMAHLIKPDYLPNRQTAERIVDLFLTGAGARKPKG
jgi:AcrR family transcriptional regulator